MATFKIRIEADSPFFDDAAMIRSKLALNGKLITAESINDAAAQLRAFGLSVIAHESAYPDAGDNGFKVWFLTGLNRVRLGNKCKLVAVRTPKKVA